MQSFENIHFTELSEHNSKVQAIFSPNGYLVANAVQAQLQVWNVQSKEILHRFECHNILDFMKWSPDSKLICCGKLKDSIQVWFLELPHWRCKIAGCLGFANIYWAPDSRHLLVISEFYLKVTVFSFVSAVITEICNPKAIESPIVFSPCDKYLIIAQRVNSEDYLAVYSCDTWEEINVFQVDTKNLSSISFSPTELVVAVLDSSVEYKVLFYCTDGRLIGKYVVEAGFGLISLSWSPRKNLIAIGDCLNQVKILDAFNYEKITVFQCPGVIESSNITIYKVNEKSPEHMNPQVVAFSSFFELDGIVNDRPFTLSAPLPENEKAKNPIKYGTQILDFSPDGKYIATVDGHFPKAVFVYDIEKLRLQDVVVRGTNIKSICWHAVKHYLIICSSCNILDIWTPEKCFRYFPTFKSDFSIINSVWSSDGDCILMNSKDYFSILYLGR